MTKERREEIENNIYRIEHIYNDYFSKENIQSLYYDLKNHKNAYLKVIQKNGIDSYDIESIEDWIISCFAPCLAFVFWMFGLLFFWANWIPYASVVISTGIVVGGSIFVGKRWAAKLFRYFLDKNSVKQKYYEYEMMLTNTLNYLNKKDKSPTLNEEKIRDSFLKEILDTITQIKLNSYPTCKEELSNLQNLSEEYIALKNAQSSNIVLTLDNTEEILSHKLEAIKNAIKSRQAEYRLQYTLEFLDKLINNENKVVKKINPQHYFIKESIVKENIDIKYLGSFEIANDLDDSTSALRSPKRITAILNRISHHKFLYTIMAHFKKSEKSGTKLSLNQTCVFTIIYSIVYFISRNIPLSLFLSLTPCYLPSLIKGNKYLNKKCLPNLQERLAELKEDKSSPELEETRVDSFIKDIIYNIKKIQDNPYKDCEQDIIKLQNLANDYATYIHRSPNYKPNLELNAETKDFYSREYEIESSFYQKQNCTKETLLVNKQIKDALENPITDNSIINEDVFVKDIIKVINIIKNNNYEESHLELQQIKTIAADYINFVYNRPNKLSYEEINIVLKNYYQKLLGVEDIIKNKQKVSDNVTEVDKLITKISTIKLDTDLDLDVNKLELKLK